MFSEDFQKKNFGFILTYPSTLVAGKNETVCLLTQNANSVTKILVDLKIKDKHSLTSNSLESGKL